MNRLFVVAALMVSLCLWGCASRETLLPPGEDPNELAAAIARRGCGDVAATPDPAPEEPGTDFLGRCFQIAGIAGAVCLCVPVVLVCLILKGKMGSAATAATAAGP